jgi:hypothetical protein
MRFGKVDWVERGWSDELVPDELCIYIERGNGCTWSPIPDYH